MAFHARLPARRESRGSRRRAQVAPPRADRRNSAVHDAILRAAARLAERYGYGRATIEAIAAEAGSGKQTIYRWWPSKAALYLELYTSLVSEARVHVDEGAVAADLRAFLKRVFEIFATTPARTILAGLIADASHDPNVADALTEQLVRRRKHLIRVLFERGFDRGEIRKDADLDFAVDTVYSAIWFRLLLGHAPFDQRFAEDLVRQVLQGIAAR